MSQSMSHFNIVIVEIPKISCDLSSVDEDYLNATVRHAPSVHVLVSGETGMIESMKIDGCEILLSQNYVKNDGTLAPSRVQLHRAVTDNDRFGYLPCWEAVGLDSDMIYVANEKYQDIVIDDGMEVEACSELKFVSVEKITTSDLLEAGQGVACRWTMEPAHINR